MNQSEFTGKDKTVVFVVLPGAHDAPNAIESSLIRERHWCVHSIYSPPLPKRLVRHPSWS
jgi:hypothetical protein